MIPWPDAELEKKMLADADVATEQYGRGPLSASVASCACHVRSLLSRVRQLESQLAARQVGIVPAPPLSEIEGD